MHCLSVARESTVVWDKKTGKPLHNIIVWPDTRNTQTVKKLAKKDSKGVDALKEKVCTHYHSLMHSTSMLTCLARFPDRPAHLYLLRRRKAAMAPGQRERGRRGA